MSALELAGWIFAAVAAGLAALELGCYLWQVWQDRRYARAEQARMAKRRLRFEGRK